MVIKMRKYAKPTLDVVKLLVREDMAAKKVSGLNGTYDGEINTTTYNLTTTTVSQANATPTVSPEQGN